MKGRLGSVEKSKNLKIVSDGMIERLLTSEDVEDVRRATDLIKARDNLRKIDIKYQQDKYIENKRQAEYIEAGYGHILSNNKSRYEMPITTRSQIDKFMEQPSADELMGIANANRKYVMTSMLTRCAFFFFAYIALEILV